MESYNELNEETKKYINKAIEVYNAIKDKNIKRSYYFWGEELEFNLKLSDKKVMALYIAGYLVDGDLKDIIEQHKEIKLDDLLEYVEIFEDDIKKLEEDKYSEIYENELKKDLSDFLYTKKIYVDINTLTPEVIFSSLGFSLNYDIISRFFDYYKIDNKIRAALMDDLHKFCLLNNYTSTKKLSAAGPMGIFNMLFNDKLFNIIDDSGSMIKTPSKSERVFKFISDPNAPDLMEVATNSNTLEKDLNIINDDVWLILDEIEKKFIGQETAAEHLFYNIINNQQLAGNKDAIDGQRSIIFLDGPTGTGKTAITKEITDKLGIPFTASSITNYSSAGYKGADLTDILEDLYKKADGNLELAERGIVVLDEFDKLSSNSTKELEMKKAVQQQLLDFLGGGKYKISIGKSIFNMQEVEFDTSKLTFICLGALTNLRENKTNTTTLGFGTPNQTSITGEYSITPQDLIDMGFERELVGRFNTYLHTEEYPKDTLIKILKESQISPIIGFKKWIESNGKTLEIEDGIYEAIADAAYELNTGARSLQTVMNNIRTHYIKEVLRGKEEVITLDLDTVISINNSVTTRKVRR